MKKIFKGAVILTLVFSLFLLTGCNKNIITKEDDAEQKKELVENVVTKPNVANGMIEKKIGELTYQYPNNIRFLDYKSTESTHMFHLYPISDEKKIVNLYIE